MDLVFPLAVPTAGDAPVVLSVRDLSRPPAFEDVSFDIRAGEIVGLAGLVGQRAHRDRPGHLRRRPGHGTVEVGAAACSDDARRAAASDAGSRSCPRAARTRAS